MAMALTLQPSLMRISAVSIAIELWKSRDIRMDLEHFVETFDPNDIYNSPYHNEFITRRFCGNKLLETVSAKVARLPLPDILKDQVEYLLKPIANEISRCYNKVFNFEVPPDFDAYLQHLRWTPFGIVNKQETLESFLNNQHFIISRHYYRSCKFCDVNFGNENSCIHFWHCRKINFRGLPEILENSEITTSISLECLEEESCRRRVKRFWLNSKLGKRIGIVEQVGYSDDIVWQNVCCQDLFFFLFTRMNYLQQMSFIESNVLVILREFLRYWPMRRFFVPTLHLMKEKDYIDGNIVIRLSNFIAKLGCDDFADVNECNRLFQELWIGSSPQINHQVTAGLSQVAPLFFLSGNIRSVELMVKNATDEEKERFFCDVHQVIWAHPNPMDVCASEYVVNCVDAFLRKLSFSDELISNLKHSLLVADRCGVCRRLINREKWESVDGFLNWALASEDEVSDFKVNFGNEEGLDICLEWMIKNNLSSVDKFANWCYCSEKDRNTFKGALKTL